MQIPGFADVTNILRAGVYVLVYHGQVVYVGKSKSMYSRIYTHRNLWNQARRGKSEAPSWLPNSVKGILFDEVHIQPCALERLDALERELISRYRPKHNTVHKPRETFATPVTVHVNGIALALNAHTRPLELVRRV